MPELTEFICPTCGFQQAKIFNDLVVCPTCNGILTLGAKIENPVYTNIESLRKTIEDLSEKLFIARRDNSPLADKIEEELIKAKELANAFNNN